MVTSLHPLGLSPWRQKGIFVLFFDDQIVT